MDTHLLLKSLRAYVDFSEDDFREFLTFLKPFTLKRKDIFYQAGTVPKYSPFILKGCVRQFVINEKGEEQTILFTEEGTWSGQVGSMRSNIPTNVTLQAIEYSELLGITLANIDLAMENFQPIKGIS